MEQATAQMSVMMAIFSYPGANETVKRHWPFFQRQQADWVYGIGTVDGKCKWPEGVSSLDVGEDRYIEGPALPNRMLDTIEIMLLMPWRVLILTEYDTVFFKQIPAESVKTVAGHHAGGPTFGSRAKLGFVHNPHCFERNAAIKFLKVGRQAIADDVCPDRGRGQPSTPECSPDVFFTLVCELAELPIQTDLWREFSKNSFDRPGALEEARQAFLSGVSVIHGIKRPEELRYITEGIM